MSYNAYIQPLCPGKKYGYGMNKIMKYLQSATQLPKKSSCSAIGEKLNSFPPTAIFKAMI